MTAMSDAFAGAWLYRVGDPVEKRSGSSWRGKVCGYYWTELTPRGYCVESAFERGSVQIYPEAALRKWEPTMSTGGTWDADPFWHFKNGYAWSDAVGWYKADAPNADRATITRLTAELNAYRSAFGGGEFNGEPIILDAETIRQRGKQYDELMDFFNQVVAAINPPDNLTPDQLTPWICTTISALRSAVATAKVALAEMVNLHHEFGENFNSWEDENSIEAIFGRYDRMRDSARSVLTTPNAVTASKGE